jgi:hypothetical protein
VYTFFLADPVLIAHFTDIYDPLTWDINMTLKERNILKTVEKEKIGYLRVSYLA